MKDKIMKSEYVYDSPQGGMDGQTESSFVRIPSSREEALLSLRCDLISGWLDTILEKTPFGWSDWRKIVSHWQSLGRPDIESLEVLASQGEACQNTLRLLIFCSWLYLSEFFQKLNERYDFTEHHR